MVKLGDIWPNHFKDNIMADNKPIAKQKQDKSPLKAVTKAVAKTDKKGNEKKREGIKDRK
jgi:hypothetical protein